MAKNGRSDSIDTERIGRNTRLIEDSNMETPFNEEIMAGDADYGERLYDQLPEDRVGFLPSNRRK